MMAISWKFETTQKSIFKSLCMLGLEVPVDQKGPNLYFRGVAIAIFAPTLLGLSFVSTPKTVLGQDGTALRSAKERRVTNLKVEKTETLSSAVARDIALTPAVRDTESIPPDSRFS